MLLVGPGLDILINIFFFLSSHPACSIKIEFILVLFDQILLVWNWSRMISCEMILRKCYLIIAGSRVKLIKQYESVIPLKPFATDEVGRRAGLLCWGHLISPSQHLKLLEFLECLIHGLRILVTKSSSVDDVQVFGAHLWDVPQCRSWCLPSSALLFRCLISHLINFHSAITFVSRGPLGGQLLFGTPTFIYKNITTLTNFLKLLIC